MPFNNLDNILFLRFIQMSQSEISSNSVFIWKNIPNWPNHISTSRERRARKVHGMLSLPPPLTNSNCQQPSHSLLEHLSVQMRPFNVEGTLSTKHACLIVLHFNCIDNMFVLSCSLLFKKTINNESSTDMRCVLVTFTSLYINWRQLKMSEV